MIRLNKFRSASKSVNRSIVSSASLGRRLSVVVIFTVCLWNFYIFYSFFQGPPEQQQLSKDHHHHALKTTINATTSLKNALTKITARNAYLYPHNTDKSQWGWKTGGPKRFQEVDVTTAQVVSMALQPYYMCPWTLHRTNYVSETIPKPQFDGGKWTCGLAEIATASDKSKRTPCCIVYSFGSNGDDFFEKSIYQQSPDCEIHIFDPTSGEAPDNWNGLNYHFHKVGLCAGNTTSFTLEGTNTQTRGRKELNASYPCKSIRSHMTDLGHTHIDILKMDVEGTEWDIFKVFDLENIGQLLVEFHFWHPSSPGNLSKLLREYIIPLEKLGYFIHTLEPVAAQIDAYEMTFLNVNWNPTSAFDDSLNQVYDVSMYPITPNVVL